MGVKRRRALSRSRGSDLTEADWEVLLRFFKECCAYCGVRDDKLTKDCVIPLARGGCYTFANVVPACRHCNSAKAGRNVVKWMKAQGLDFHKFEQRMVELLWA